MQTMHSMNVHLISPTGFYHRVRAITQNWSHRIQNLIEKKATPLDPFYEVQYFDHSEEVWRPLKTSIFCKQDANAAYQLAQAEYLGDSRDVRLVRFASEVVKFTL